jgi:hypothetical protein
VSGSASLHDSGSDETVIPPDEAQFGSILAGDIRQTFVLDTITVSSLHSYLDEAHILYITDADGELVDLGKSDTRYIRRATARHVVRRQSRRVTGGSGETRVARRRRV